MVEESKDEELPLLEAPAPRFGDDACTEDEALDTSVPVAFLTSTRANPDLGYRVPTSASALLATLSQDRAALRRQETLARRAFSMAEVDVREHARARGTRAWSTTPDALTRSKSAILPPAPPTRRIPIHGRRAGQAPAHNAH